MVASSWFWEVLPFVAMVISECLDVGLTTLSKAAMIQGMSHFVFVVYSNAIASLILLPCSFLFQRRARSTLTFPLLCRFFFLGLTGVTIMQNCAFTGIKYSSPTLASSMGNLIPAFTFILAIIFRLEELNIRSPSSQAKIIGTLVSISGALVVILYKGPAIWSSSSSIPLHLFPQQSLSHSAKRENWVLGAVFLLIATFSVSVWNILQAATVKNYPWEITIIAFNCFAATIQCAIVSLIAERKHPSAWRLNHNIEIISTVYTAVVGNVFTFIVQIWCIRKKGPIFMAMFKPLGIAIAALMSAIFLGDTLHLGSVIGAIIIVAGFYGVIWGLAREKRQEGKQDGNMGSPTKNMPPSEGSTNTESA